jgi:outer membrane protein
MKFSKTFTILFVALISLSTQAQEMKQWDLEACVNHAYENSLTVQRSQLALKDNEALVKQGKLSRLPTLNMNVFNSWRWGRSIDPTTNLFTTQRINSNGANASSNFLLYQGSRLSRSIKQGEMNVQASMYDLEKAKNDVALDVVFGYLQIIFTRELLENAREQLKTTKTQMDQTAKFVDAGSLPITNLLDLQSQVAGNEVDVINAENDVNLAVLQLKQFLQIPAEEPFDIVTPDFSASNYAFVTMSVGEVFETAEQTQPEIKSADIQIESAQMGVKIARSDHIPQVGLQGQFFTNYSDQNKEFTGAEQIPDQFNPIGFLQSNPSEIVVEPTFRTFFNDINIPTQWADNRSWSAGFNIAVPIFNGWSTQTNVQRAKIQEDLAEINAIEARNVLRQTIETAYNDAQAAAKVFEAAQKQVDALEESFRATEKSYNLGAVNFVDYQVASFNLFSARSSQVRSKFDYIFKLKVLDFYLGNPLTL